MWKTPPPTELPPHQERLLRAVNERLPDDYVDRDQRACEMAGLLFDVLERSMPKHKAERFAGYIVGIWFNRK